MALWLTLDSQIYKRFHDIILPSSNGTTQIDHVLISHYGVFIVETKNKTGWIFGGDEQEQWTQTVFGKKYQFQNPVRQTYRQKRILAEFLGISELFIYPVVYFVGDCKFKTPLPSNVINYGLGNYIKNFNEQILSQDEVNRMIAVLEQHLSGSNLSNRDHVRSLKERHNSKTICPKCGGSLIERVAKKGPTSGSTFLGCGNYPNCKFSRSI
ncbi:MAG: NERD domain-containing protein [Bacteriovoracaceae bacterium]|nr:NERD domain-containing protein [Bacteriovoracaceae bacterium]